MVPLKIGTVIIEVHLTSNLVATRQKYCLDKAVNLIVRGLNYNVRLSSNLPIIATREIIPCSRTNNNSLNGAMVKWGSIFYQHSVK